MTFHWSLPNFGMKCRAWRRYCWTFRTDQLSRERTDTALSHQSRLPSTITFPLQPLPETCKQGNPRLQARQAMGNLPWRDRQVAGGEPQESHSFNGWGTERCYSCIAQAQAEKSGLANWPYCWTFKKSECSERNYFTLPQSDCRPSYSIIQRWLR